MAFLAKEAKQIFQDYWLGKACWHAQSKKSFINL